MPFRVRATEQELPALAMWQPLFAEWEHKWWPNPMEKGKRAQLPAFAPRVAAAE